MTGAREVLTWDGFGDATRELSRKIVADGFAPEVVVAIARGGLLPAGAIAYGLGSKNCGALNVEFYTDVDARLPMPVVLPPVPRQVDLSEKKVLVVDDVADTGGTLALVRDFCAEHVLDIRTAVIYEKPHSIVKCDYVWRATDKWIDFPWSSLPPLVAGVQAQ